MVISPPPPLVAPPPAASASAGRRYGFDNSTLGESFAAWRGADPRHARADCSPGGATVVCRVADRPLGGGYAARDLTFTFVDGRLTTLSFRSSIDGFASVMATLDQRFGPPERVVRDTLVIARDAPRPHVLMMWRNGRSTIALDDPTADAVHLVVGMSLDARSARSHSDSAAASGSRQGPMGGGTARL